MKYALNLAMGNFIEAPTVAELKSRIAAERWYRDYRSDVWKLFPDWESMHDFRLRKAIAHTVQPQDTQQVYVATFNKIEQRHGSYERTQGVFGVFNNQYDAIVQLSRKIREELDTFDGNKPLIRQRNLDNGDVEISASDSKAGSTIELLGYIATMPLQ